MAMQKQVAYPVGLGADDSVQFSIAAIGIVIGKIRAVRVEDITRQILFNWVDGSWYTPTPSCVPGVENLRIMFFVENQGEVGGDLTLTLKKTIQQPYGPLIEETVAQVTGYADLGGIVELEWIGDMPAYPLIIKCIAEP